MATPDTIPTKDRHDFDDVEDEQLQAALDTVHQTLAHIDSAAYDLTDPADLERLRQELPTDPQAARLLQKSLPTPLRQTFEYVEGSERQRAYWRCAPERDDLDALSNAELRSRLAFARVNMDQRGTRGTTRTPDGRYVTAAAQEAADELRGADFHDPDDPPTETERRRGRRLLDRVKEVLSR